MNHSDFTKCMEMLIETYGDRAYPTPRVTRIWNWARRVHSKSFAEAVDNAIADCAHAPLLSKLKDYYAEVRAKYPDREKINCDYCDGSGFVLAEGAIGLAYACRCEAGQLVPVYVCRWNGPWVRMVPRKEELLRPVHQEKFKATLDKTFKKIDAVEVDYES